MIGLATHCRHCFNWAHVKENGLVEYEHIDVSSRLIANPVSYRMKSLNVFKI